MNWRKIVVDEKEYRWTGGSAYVVVQDTNGKRVLGASACEIKGITPDVWERGKWKGTSDGMITPGEVAAFIKKKVSE